ncbi:PF05853 family protein (plasmid) [Neorhizobium galegae bv. officinalis bv. officinalis str. HAMBI 1141]|uniref:PF05853 family protein n=1 Tax=Neorhizobium galegae bv. officinalis bv. officinalis str. HAMBI 1141 TaxID=1028801 RepID=A0A068TKY9_NEOGA|nr:MULTISPECIES: 3-keto-5-aminohexanoate cleavage protein [Neorhizobium]MCJ9669078.1 3-keto-5-aminohexanoate cleavage protein [Neorhizobium sp. SHOUNA12B]MCJ9743115.1 3-keto-5-aminohexanoate cleavage protein [Neorhizobium sp. SHOUNA12A]CDN58250.1 PF05853 family protein [Neorhizobium galegae bv. officinalis bv. officinalis str. HAMBI 1141]
MADPTIITCAVTGNITSPSQTPYLPITPEQIANACLEATRAGAAIVHIHVRHPDGRPSMELSHYREVVERLRAADDDVIINLTTGPGGRFIPSEDDPKTAAPGTTLLRPELRVEHIAALRPEICSLDFNTMYSGTSVVINTPRNLAIMADIIQNAGVLPELEVFDTGDIQLANHFLQEGRLDGPALFQIVLGVRYGAIATPETLLYMKSLLPTGSHWAAFGVGRFEFPMLAQAWLAGGHVRVGLEDNIYLEKGVLAESNTVLVQKAVRIVKELGGTIATVGETREILKLKKQLPMAI